MPVPTTFLISFFFLSYFIYFARSQATYVTSLDSSGNAVLSISIDYSTGIVYAGGQGGIFYISSNSPPVSTTIIPYQQCTAGSIYVNREQLYATCSNNGVIVVSLPSYLTRTLASTSVCPAPQSIYVDDSTATVYVACFGNGPSDGKVISINGSSITTLANYSVCAQPINVIKTANGILYAACYNSGLISINGTSVTSIANAAQCYNAYSLTVNGNTVYATCFGGTNTGLVIAYNPSSGISPIVGASQPSCVYANGIDYVNGNLYTACLGQDGVPFTNGDGTVMSVNVESGTVLNSFTTVSQCSFPSCVNVNTITGVIYACCTNNLFISITLCPVGSFCPSGSLGPTICPAGSYCPQTGLYSNILCDGGFYCPFANASSVGPICPSGSFCAIGSFNYTYCPAGSYCPTTGLSAPIPCPAGYYCPQMNSTSIGPACIIGSYCGQGSTSQQLCVEGNYCPNPSIQTPCPAGHYCSSGLSAIGPTCTISNYCPTGSFAEVSCAIGYYCPDTTSQISCAPTHVCPEAGMTSPGPQCTDPGYYSTGTACIACQDTTDTTQILSCSANYMCSNCKNSYLVFSSLSITYNANYFYSFGCALCSRPFNTLTITNNPNSDIIYKCDSHNDVQLTSDIYYECLNITAEIYISYAFIVLISVISLANLVIYVFVYPKAYKSTKDFSLLLLWIDGSTRILDYLYYIQTDIENYTMQTIYFYSYFAPIITCLILFFILWCYKGEFAPSTKTYFHFVSSPFDYPFNSLKLWRPVKKTDSLEKFLIFCIVGFIFVSLIWFPIALLCSFLLIESFPQLWILRAMLFEKNSKDIPTIPHKGLQQLFLATSSRYASFLSLNYSIIGVLPRLIIQILNYLQVSSTISTITILTFVKTGYLLSRNVFAQCYACCIVAPVTDAVHDSSSNNNTNNNKNNNTSNVIDVQVQMEPLHTKDNTIHHNKDKLIDKLNTSTVHTPAFSDSDQAELDVINKMMELQQKQLELLQKKRQTITEGSES